MDEKKLKEELPDDLDPMEEEEESEYNILDELTPEQFSRLQESIRQASAGNTIPHEKAMALLNAWLEHRSRQNL